MDIDTYWEYSDPAASEARFRAALEGASGDERLEILTQVARSYGLRKRFDEASRLLDEIAPQAQAAGPRVRARYLLERGRTLNSSGRREEARPRFVEAWDVALAAREEGLAVDAAHMVAITYSGTDGSFEWTDKGLALARGSKDAKAASLVPALLNNSAWDLYDLGRLDEALARFREAQREWEARGKPRQVHVARWSVARCLRAMGRHDEALAVLSALQAEDAAAGAPDPQVAAEIARNVAKDASAG
ncbi:MAG TPA: tetratricopeptide repeat protein [Usitatibacter sp.]|nr:tetratricopeptide repeat protein [Usitatibacter sp.]